MEAKPAENPEDRISIGEAASILALHVQSVRSLEDRGLLVPVHRTPGGFRRYRRGDVIHLRDNPPARAKRSAPVRRTVEAERIAS